MNFEVVPNREPSENIVCNLSFIKGPEISHICELVIQSLEVCVRER